MRKEIYLDRKGLGSADHFRYFVCEVLGGEYVSGSGKIPARYGETEGSWYEFLHLRGLSITYEEHIAKKRKWPRLKSRAILVGTPQKISRLEKAIAEQEKVLKAKRKEPLYPRLTYPQIT